MTAPPSFRTRTGIHFALLTLLLLTQPLQATYQTGLDAYTANRHTTAMDEWKAVIATPPGQVNPATYAETHYAIGMLYWMGMGVTKDYYEASKWLHKAGELNHAGAQGKLGYLYTEGITVDQNYKTAFKWFSKAAKQGDVDGQYNLGILYLNGWGTQQDQTMAAQYFAAAAAQGDATAEAALQNVIPAKAGTSQTSLEPKNEPIFHPTQWILNQAPNHYTIQVIGLSTQVALKDLVRNHHHLAPYATYTLIRKNKPLHLLIQGNYPTVEAARKARDNFPKAIQSPKNVWIRKFNKIQELIKPETTQN